MDDVTNGVSPGAGAPSRFVLVPAPPGHLVGEAPVRESIAAMGAELDDPESFLDQAGAVAETLRGREKVLPINHRLARRLIAAHREWIAELVRKVQ